MQHHSIKNCPIIEQLWQMFIDQRLLLYPIMFSMAESGMLWSPNWSCICEQHGGTSTFSSHSSLTCRVNISPSLMCKQVSEHTFYSIIVYRCWKTWELNKYDKRERNIRSSGHHHRPYKFTNGGLKSKTCLVHMFYFIRKLVALSIDLTISLDGFMGRDAGIRWVQPISLKHSRSNLSQHVKLCDL